MREDETVMNNQSQSLETGRVQARFRVKDVAYREESKARIQVQVVKQDWVGYAIE